MARAKAGFDFDRVIRRIERQAERAIAKANQNPIAMLNDRCRTALGIGARVVQTRGISALPQSTQSKIREGVETFKDFNKDNNPWGENDFGSFTVDGVDVMFKIDYYDTTYTYGSEDPSNPAITRRVLTIMLSEEY